MNQVERMSGHSGFDQRELGVLSPILPDDLADNGARPANATRKVQFHSRLHIALYRFLKTQQFSLLFGYSHIQTSLEGAPSLL
jgi:hypothetical protein